MQLIHFAILSPFLLAFVVPFLFKYVRRIHTGWFVLILPILLFTYFIQMLQITSNGRTLFSQAEWIPSLGMNFTVYVDGLSLLFALLITGIGALVVLYSIFYLSKEKEQLGSFYTYLLMFMTAMLGVVLSDNMVVLYLFWELTSISSFLLIGYWYKRERSRYGATKSLLITVFGGLAMLGGFILIYLITDSFSIREAVNQLQLIMASPYFIPAMVLILLGAFTKSAQFPFYIWLPDAMEAPTPVSSYLHSATMVKAGIYLVARFSPIFAISEVWFWTISIVGLITLFWGSFHAVRQNDLKAILAFSTVSQLGMIMLMLGVGAAAIHENNPAFFGAAVLAAIFHLINHATFKGSLFMAAGIIDHETGTRDIRKLGGLMTIMPITFTITLIGTFSMAGLPPFNGFLSKELFFTSMIRISDISFTDVSTWGAVFPAIAWLASVFTFIYSMMIVFKTFRGRLNVDQLEKKPHEAPIGMLIPPIILASLVVTFFFFPNILAYSVIEPAMQAIIPEAIQTGSRFAVKIEAWHGFKPELYMTIGVVALGTIGYLTLSKWRPMYNIFKEKWSFNALYDRSLIGVEKGSYRLTNSYMTGFLRDYLVYVFGFMIIVLGSVMFYKQAFSFQTEHAASIGTYEVILSLVMVAATVTTVFARSRLTAIIALGVMGYTLSLFFVIFRAPDLALTQLIIETISVALFLLCFYHLPKLSLKQKTRRFKLTNLIISLGVGVVVTCLAFASTSQQSLDTISTYFIENSYKLAGGDNIVNVILVDFRGFDTLFEITVLAIAALGIYGLLKVKTQGKRKRGVRR
ncbi:MULTISPECIES: Na+/H+ antiporter subunit A [Bacillus]|uniref:Na+/H+ antiporter subunit A n=1 Tax=Bacillus TaxID=1386 RepID=UPI00045C688A|nr:MULTISPECIES: Na+/H+ antiporter subunit A [Bacillus]ANT57825.1 cation:proton antiporter [Bacillus pumilus]KDE31922.1 monovalent cation/H+ antiporter subunit A [Bacillus altitudinis 41KF2b]MCA0120116.1 Na+/H+ antiporter subunit A [Bacillus sp. RSS_NA_20]MEC1041811.1 Na+/H+ antiporter subunit A [Bacillus altitudinis]MEC1090101.1 Na+/H+ antiporter subunit A [Bacillus altitudinis]